MQQGNIAVQTENIFPIIKKFLYSDHEIFLRELVSNAVDATQKLKKLASLGETKGEIGDTNIEIKIDEKAKTLSIIDKGIGMTEEEVNKYINQIALSSAGEFLEKYKDLEDGKSIIGHFGLGFYSSFMVSEKVEIITKSHHADAGAVKWTCDGNPEFTLEPVDKKERGTEVVLHINEESKEFLEKSRIDTLLGKYCKFLPVAIKFGTKDSDVDNAEGNKIKVDNIINNPTPAWTKPPSELKDEDYKNFYNELHPFSEPPLFWIHLNVDYPFNLTGVLYFPKLKNNLDMQRNKIQLFCNQVFVTDEVKEIVPEWLTLLHGVIDSPDIPLNVSRSYLQSDPNVKKITSYITKKVADKLEEIFKDDRKSFEEKWEHMSVIVKYGMLTDEKFYERAQKFCLLENVDGKFFTFEEYKEHIKANQTDKDEKQVVLYTPSETEQHNFVETCKGRGYDVLKTDEVIDNHFTGFLEGKWDKTSFKRVDSETIDNLIDKGENVESVLSEKEVEKLKEAFEGQVGEKGVTVQMKALSPEDNAVTIVKPEWMRRMREMSAMNGMDMGAMPDQYNLVVNTNHPVASKILNSRGANKERLTKQMHDLALLSQNMLKGAELTNFVNRSMELIGK